MQDFKKLIVWQKAHELTLGIYRATKTFPRDELYGVTNQIRRAAMSVPSNIAEGCGRNSNIELARFLEIAMGSASETEYQLLLARDLSYLQSSDYETLSSGTTEVKRMLASLIIKLRTDN